MESICLSLHEYLHVINSSLGHLLPIQTDMQGPSISHYAMHARDHWRPFS